MWKKEIGKKFWDKNIFYSIKIIIQFACKFSINLKNTLDSQRTFYNMISVKAKSIIKYPFVVCWIVLFGIELN